QGKQNGPSQSASQAPQRSGKSNAGTNSSSSRSRRLAIPAIFAGSGPADLRRAPRKKNFFFYFSGRERQPGDEVNRKRRQLARLPAARFRECELHLGQEAGERNAQQLLWQDLQLVQSAAQELHAPAGLQLHRGLVVAGR